MRFMAIVGLVVLLIAAGCATQEAGLANPASVYCEQQGGRVEIVDGPDGQHGICMLPDGKVCDEWAFFRGECPGEECGECPQLSPPAPGWCDDGRVVAGEIDACGCQGAPRCEPVACAADAKICPDGSAVARVAPDCEFAPCP
jgi:putative hemolysin